MTAGVSSEVESRPSVSRRLAARVIDYLALAAVGFGVGRLVGFGFGWLAGSAALVFGYFVVGDAAAGTTVGKAALGLRVKTATGARPSVRDAVVREAFVLLGAIPFVGPLLALVAWITLLLTIRKSPLGQGWHDRWAGGTRVSQR